MSLHPDLSDSSLLEAFDDVRNEASPTNWVLYGYVPKTDKIKVDSTGTGGFAEMCESMSDGRVNYGFIRYNVNGTFKFVYVAWCGEGVTGIRKGSFGSHAQDMSKFLDGYHVQINARNEEDLDETKILARLKTATASHGRRNEKAKVQGTTGPDTTPTRQAAPKRDVGEDLKAESAAFWDKQRAEEAEAKRRNEEAQKNRNAPAPSAGRNMGKQWEQKQQQQQEAPPPQRAAPATSGGAARIAASFNNPPAQAPPPKAVAPPPKAPAAVAPPPPAPVEEDWGAAPAHEEESSGYEEHHEEPQYGGEEQSYGGEEQSYGGEEQQHYEEPPAEEPQYGGEDQSYGGEDQSYGGEDQSYGGEDQSYGGEDQSYGGDAGQSAGGLGQCRALYDYQGENEGDLTFNEGDIINLLDQSNPDGWWEGEINGRQGFFPSNFVQAI